MLLGPLGFLVSVGMGFCSLGFGGGHITRTHTHISLLVKHTSKSQVYEQTGKVQNFVPAKAELKFLTLLPGRRDLGVEYLVWAAVMCAWVRPIDPGHAGAVDGSNQANKRQGCKEGSWACPQDCSSDLRRAARSML